MKIGERTKRVIRKHNKSMRPKTYGELTKRILGKIKAGRLSITTDRPKVVED